jgi:hypothetical protein
MGNREGSYQGMIRVVLCYLFKVFSENQEKTYTVSRHDGRMSQKVELKVGASYCHGEKFNTLKVVTNF